MKKLALFTLLSAAAIAQAEMRVVDAPVEVTYPESAIFVEREVTPTGAAMVEEEVYPTGYSRGYRRPVAGVVGGAATATEGVVQGAATTATGNVVGGVETATEGVVEGTAQAVNSVLP